jgi:hypothetical protein
MRVVPNGPRPPNPWTHAGLILLWLIDTPVPSIPVLRRTLIDAPSPHARMYVIYRIGTDCTARSMDSFLTRLQRLLKLNRQARRLPREELRQGFVFDMDSPYEGHYLPRFILSHGCNWSTLSNALGGRCTTCLTFTLLLVVYGIRARRTSRSGSEIVPRVGSREQLQARGERPPHLSSYDVRSKHDG